MYQRKTHDEYHVMGDYGYGDGFEVLTRSYTRKEAKEDYVAYCLNDPYLKDLKIVKRRVKNES